MRDQIYANPLGASTWIWQGIEYRVPGYPLFLALLKLVSESEFWIRVVQGLLTLNCLLMGMSITKRLEGNELVFGILWSLIGIQFYFSQKLLSETLSLWLFTSVVWLIVSNKIGWLYSALRGIAITSLLFVKPAMSVFVPLIAWNRSKTILIAGIVALAIAAWGLVLKEKSGEWTFMGAGGGLNLFIFTLPKNFELSNEDLDQYWLEEQYQYGHPSEIGWYEYDKRLKKAAFERFPDWNLGFERFVSLYFYRQYNPGLNVYLFSYGVLLLLGTLSAFQFRFPLLSLIALGPVSLFYLIAPYARFIFPASVLLVSLLAVELSFRFREWNARKRFA